MHSTIERQKPEFQSGTDKNFPLKCSQTKSSNLHLVKHLNLILNKNVFSDIPEITNYISFFCFSIISRVSYPFWFKKTAPLLSYSFYTALRSLKESNLKSSKGWLFCIQVKVLVFYALQTKNAASSSLMKTNSLCL